MGGGNLGSGRGVLRKWRYETFESVYCDTQNRRGFRLNLGQRREGGKDVDIPKREGVRHEEGETKKFARDSKQGSADMGRQERLYFDGEPQGGEKGMRQMKKRGQKDPKEASTEGNAINARTCHGATKEGPLHKKWSETLIGGGYEGGPRLEKNGINF